MAVDDDNEDYLTSAQIAKKERGRKSTSLIHNKAADARKRYAFLLGQTDIFGK